MDLLELEKTRSEKEICKDIFVAIKKVLNRLRLKDFADSIDFNLENIQIFSKEVYYSYFPEHSRGTNNWGEAHLIRSDNVVEFISDATHELSHCASFREVDVVGLYVENEGEEEFLQKRIGFEEIGKEGQRKFFGLMEAATEIFALHVRSEFLKFNKVLSTKERSMLLDERAYSWAIDVVEGVLNTVSEDENHFIDLLDELLKGHITGSYAFLEKIEKKIPGVTEVLAEMGVSPENALVAAEKLQLIEKAEGIRNFIESNKIEAK